MILVNAKAVVGNQHVPVLPQQARPPLMAAAKHVPCRQAKSPLRNILVPNVTGLGVRCRKRAEDQEF